MIVAAPRTVALPLTALRTLAMIQHLVRAVVLVLILLAPAAAAERLVLGIHPFLPPEELREAFSPLAREIGKRLGIPISLSIAKDYSTHIRDIGEGRVDIAFVGPVPYVNLVKKYGPFPLLACLEVRGRPFFTGIIFVAEQAHLQRLQDLRGRRFAFGDRLSTMGHVVPVYMLERAGVPLSRLASYKHLNDHENVVLGVLVGDFDAGAVKDDVFERFRSRGLRALAVSPPIPEHVFVARRTMPASTVQQIQRTLIALPRDEAGLQVLRSIRSDVTGLVSVADRDYDELRVIHATVFRGGHLP